MRCYNIELLAPKNGLSIHEIWVHIIHGYRLFSRMDRPFLGCVLCTGAHYTRKITVYIIFDAILVYLMIGVHFV